MKDGPKRKTPRLKAFCLTYQDTASEMLWGTMTASSALKDDGVDGFFYKRSTWVETRE